MISQPRHALILVRSPIIRDPRVRRQIEWLREAGFVVDTVGLEDNHAPGVRDHFGLRPGGRWTKLPLAYGFVYAVLPMRMKFRALTSNQIPYEARARLARGAYDLVILNDHHFLPLVGDPRVFTPSTSNMHVHLDLHEYVRPDLPRKRISERFTARYWRWQRHFIGDARFTTRTTVSPGISDLYAKDFGIHPPALVVNAPPYLDQDPSPVESKNIRLLHHGAAAPQRGLFQLIDAMHLIDERFTLTLILVGSPEWIKRFREYAEPLGNRIRFEEPVPMSQISTAINEYDLEVMFFPPINKSLKYALPNKLFEAVQGRLGLVIGPSPTMVEVVQRFGNGVVTGGWEAEDLARAINALTPSEVADLKAASDRSARELSDAASHRAFINVLGLASHDGSITRRANSGT